MTYGTAPIPAAVKLLNKWKLIPGVIVFPRRGGLNLVRFNDASLVADFLKACTSLGLLVSNVDINLYQVLSIANTKAS